ncbi:Asparaginyl-tRNA synthetase [Spraguea lophii 42_110]|uniref:asparagine--tRNA ligase n=1 Tax=Spraguea lophii (strain 42_110) TaxID=1358809 RepID=S7W9T2_SPRLO|nr:Asparaginyl-tRNA synthetase [Spraguea lophii 42_110]
MTDFDISKYEKVALPKITKDLISKHITTFGWIETIRTGKNNTFIDLYAGFKTIKLVMSSSIVEQTLTPWTSIKIYGVVQENYKKGKDAHEFEIHVDRLEVQGNVAPPFPINSETSKFSMLEYGHLALRTKERRFFLQASSYLMKLCRDYYYNEDYIEIRPPTIVTTQVEGGSTLFSLDYYGTKAYLTQSSQLYLETVAPVAQRAFCIMPSYRAEKSDTSRHLSEYTHVECELVDIDFNDLMNEIEGLVKYCTENFYAKFKDTILELYPNFEFHDIAKKPFIKMDYSDAIKFLQENKYLKEDKTSYEQGDDIPDHAERYIVNEYGKGQPIFLTRFLTSEKPFYMRLDDNDNNYTESVDLLFPGVGEIVGGSMRKEQYEEILQGLEQEGINPAPYYWYTDIRKFGPSAHGGYGLGFERLLTVLMRWDSINKATLYPRNVTRSSP